MFRETERIGYMYNEITMKQFIKEVIHKRKVLCIITILVAIGFCVYSYIDLKHQTKMQQFGAYGEIAVQNVSSEDAADDSHREAVLLTNQEVMKAVVSDPIIEEYGFSIEDIKNKIYVREVYGSLLKIYVVADTQEIASNICQAFVKMGGNYLLNQGVAIDIRESSESLGSVTVEKQDDNKYQGEQIPIIKPSVTASINFVGWLKRAITGLLFGLVLSSLGICIRFIFDGRIRYLDQINEDAHFLISETEMSDGEYLKLYSYIVNSASKNSVVNFISLQHSDRVHRFIRDFADFIGKYGIKVLVVKYDIRVQGVKSIKNDCMNFNEIVVGRACIFDKNMQAFFKNPDCEEADIIFFDNDLFMQIKDKYIAENIVFVHVGKDQWKDFFHIKESSNRGIGVIAFPEK